MKYFSLIVLIFSVILIGCGKQTEQNKDAEDVTMLKEKIAKFVPTELKYDSSTLDEREKIVVEKLYRASKIMDELFLDQVYSKNYQMRDDLKKGTSEEDKLKLELFTMMFGPFDRLEHDAPFIDTLKKPLGANFYPEDMTKEEFETWIKDNPQDEKAFQSEFTVIRRDDGKLTAIPYSEYFKDKLTEASNLLKEAAEYSDNPSLKKYLNSRADAFLSNDYYQSDMDWMDLKDHKIEIVIGPYEVYEDGMFNLQSCV